MMPRLFRVSTLGLALLCGGLAGCSALVPAYQRPAVDLPAHWSGSSAGQGLASAVDRQWWRHYQDAQLTQLITEALQHNDDLALASARWQQAQAQLQNANANRLPLVTAGGSASRGALDLSKSVPLVSQSPTPFAVGGAMLSYEVDLWGKLANTAHAAEAQVQAAHDYRDAAALSLSGSVANLYFSRQALTAQIAIQQQAIAAADQRAKVVNLLFTEQAADKLTQQQAVAAQQTARAQLPGLLSQRDQIDSALAVLLGRSPQAMFAAPAVQDSPLSALPVPPVTPGDLPSTLLTRRADISSAEQALQASHYQIGVARAAYFPTLSLSGLLGVADVDIQNLYHGGVRAWSLGGSLVGPVLDFGRTASGVAYAEGQQQEQVVKYQQAVRTAFREVKDALAQQQHSADEEQAREQAWAATRENLRLARLQLAAGYSSVLEVITAEQQEQSAHAAWLAVRLQRLQASVAMYKALGGGWQAG